MIKVAMIGFGGIAKNAHLPAYRNLEKAGLLKLVAVCDVDSSCFDQASAINIGGTAEDLSADVARYTDWREMTENEEFDMVDICAPTYLHADLAIEMLGRGYHVFSEKPMALCYEDCLLMCRAADEVDKKLMIGQCLRFGNEYRYLKKVVEENTFGKPLSGIFRRLSPPPVWGYDNWFLDEKKSGGCLLDMHIHDVDMIRYLFGEPQTVSCYTQNVYSKNDIAHSRLCYNGFSMLAIGDWSQEGVPFTADFRVAFEKATVDFADGKITVYPRGGGACIPDWEQNNFYESEIEFFVRMLEGGCENTENPPESAAETVRLVEALRESANNGGLPLAYK